jgi:hypothetical protein
VLLLLLAVPLLRLCLAQMRSLAKKMRLAGNETVKSVTALKSNANTLRYARYAFSSFVVAVMCSLLLHVLRQFSPLMPYLLVTIDAIVLTQVGVH